MTAFKAAFSDMKLVKTRQVAQLIFEIPIEEFDAAYEVLGGMPVPSRERWFGIAAINSQAEKEHAATAPVEPKPAGAKPARDWRDVQPAAQSGIRCAEPTFRAFLRETRGLDVHDKLQAEIAVRDICAVNSRVEFSTKPDKAALWRQIDDAYQAWSARERVGA